jgi:hypothetical protein
MINREILINGPVSIRRIKYDLEKEARICHREYKEYKGRFVKTESLKGQCHQKCVPDRHICRLDMN